MTLPLGTVCRLVPAGDVVLLHRPRAMSDMPELRLLPGMATSRRHKPETRPLTATSILNHIGVCVLSDYRVADGYVRDKGLVRLLRLWLIVFLHRYCGLDSLVAFVVPTPFRSARFGLLLN